MINPSRLLLLIASAITSLSAPLLWVKLVIAQPPIETTPNLVTPASNANISFRRPLRVTRIQVPNNERYRQSEYRFTFDFPADAVEPLEKMVFEQIEGVDYPHYRPASSYAFGADSRTQFPLIATDDDSNRTLTTEFDPPIEPGHQITVVLQARNPRDGIYVYQLTAYPVGATEGQYAGVERFNIDEPSRERFFWP